MHIVGDLICDMLKTDSDSNIPTKKLKSYELHQLTQLIDEATRVTMTTTSLIDHIVTNTPEKISDSGVIHTGISDHSLVFEIRKMFVIIKKQENTLEIRNLKNFDEKKFTKELLKQHWEYVYFFAEDPNAIISRGPRQTCTTSTQKDKIKQSPLDYK